ncbi:DUF4197 domain-containing protein [Solitalea canadensis]|uniref:DUF4197 domain-containing protein n=1 Tax=Solitalea canadensis (strain ATCC 29591 / DSM 3403 / JCM 21819 / LMG 8368 / NBRC 15130 / NCIMB 12057 / USAM 9D) TaxID=929556 RepID=H8KS62_SOLCM|nr:DUF4197 domain-containing protein [Solitalea canadensis]AFD07850.1 hypothetical protein Solca_2824 [Solitalea canadensis DSM 3403]
MIKKVALTIVLAVTLTSCESQNLLKQVTDIYNQTTANGQLTNTDIANGLKQALNKGIDTAVAQVAKPDGFLKDQAIKILLPAELQKVDKTLRNLGMGKLADEGLKLMNRAAEDAAGKGKTIFVNAIKQMTFQDAMGILMGDKNAATQYLKRTTSQQLYSEFNPIIKNSLDQVGAAKVWSQIITRYNQVPMVTKVNPDLTDYVTNKAMDGLFYKVEQEELAIRKDPINRTTDLLKKVFSKQDGK